MAAPDIAQNASQQIVDTEHLLKVLLEQPNGLARRIVSKAGSNPTLLLERTDQYIRQQPRVTGDSSQVMALAVMQSPVALRRWRPVASQAHAVIYQVLLVAAFRHNLLHSGACSDLLHSSTCRD